MKDVDVLGCITKAQMARIVALDEIDPRLRNHLNSILRVVDEAVVLPQSQRSPDSGSIKNVVCRLNGSEPNVSVDIFSPNWFCGVSVVEIQNEKAEPLLSDEGRRSSLLNALSEAIPSEMQDSQLQVGPDLDGDEQDRDIDKWTAGFDGPGSCCGLYSALQSRAPEATYTGMSRVHSSYYLVCKAGAGVAGQTFHARLTAALNQGSTLDECLAEDGDPGAKALRRVANAAKRNRGRILIMAAEALGFFGVDTIGDNASPLNSPYRIAIPSIDVCYNSLTQIDTYGSRHVWQYASGCVDTALSHGVVVSSNVAEGFVAFKGVNGESQVSIRNDAYSCVPFSTPRLGSNRDVVFRAVERHKSAKKSGNTKAHPDNDWIARRFSWHSKEFDSEVEIAPPCVWGSHESESFISEWARELGVSRVSPVRLHPEIVALSAMEPGKLRVAVKAVVNS